MSHPESHTRYEELAAGMALHALEPEDEQDFLAHLSGCPTCPAALLEHEAVLGQLAFAADAVEPPLSLLEGIRAGMRASGRQVDSPADPPGATPRTLTPPMPPTLTPLTTPTPDPATTTSTDPAPASLDDARRRRNDRTRRSATWAGAAAAAALVVSLGVWGAELREQRDDQARLSAQLAGTLERLRDPSTETVRLQSDGGDVVAVALVSGNEVELVLDGLPVNEEGTSYVLWDEAPDGALRGVGAFDVTSGDLEVHRGIQLAGGTQRLLVTREQGETPPDVPTLPVLAVGQV